MGVEGLSLVTGDRIDLSVQVDSADQLRALYQSQKRAIASERTEINRLAGLRATGYGDEDTYHYQLWRARARFDMLERVIMEVTTEMMRRGIQPWE